MSQVKDDKGLDIYTGAVCWIQKFPDAEYGKESSEREWIIKVSELVMLVGGKA